MKYDSAQTKSLGTEVVLAIFIKLIIKGRPPFCRVNNSRNPFILIVTCSNCVNNQCEGLKIEKQKPKRVDILC